MTKYCVNNINNLAQPISVDLYIVNGDATVSDCIIHSILTRTARRQDAVLAVLTMSGSCQGLNQPFISVSLPRDDAKPHQALMGSHATGKRASNESTGVNGEL